MNNDTNGRPLHTKLVVVLGDEATTAQHSRLAQTAAAHERTIAHHSTFASGALLRPTDLGKDVAVVDAGATAVALACPVWLPYPSDVGCEDNLRRLHLGLRSAGIELLVGPEMTQMHAAAALSPLDHALRTEIAHVQELAAAIAASAGVTHLLTEITAELAATATTKPHVLVQEMTWDEQAASLARYAHQLSSSGLTQSQIAAHLNELGHRTKRGKRWTQVQVSRLIASKPSSHPGDSGHQAA